MLHYICLPCDKSFFYFCLPCEKYLIYICLPCDKSCLPCDKSLFYISVYLVTNFYFTSVYTVTNHVYLVTNLFLYICFPCDKSLFYISVSLLKNIYSISVYLVTNIYSISVYLVTNFQSCTNPLRLSSLKVRVRGSAFSADEYLVLNPLMRYIHNIDRLLYFTEVSKTEEEKLFINFLNVFRHEEYVSNC